MKLWLSILLLFFSFTSQAQEEENIHKSFYAYKQAIIEKNGRGALALIDSNTVAYYDRILDVTLKSDSSQVIKLPIIDKIMVLTFRHHIKKNNLLTMDTRQLISHAIQMGLIGDNGIQDMQLGDISITDNEAKAKMIHKGEQTPYFFYFHKQQEQWKMDLTALFPLSTMAFTSLIDQSGKEENAFIISLIGMSTKKEVSKTIWKPLVK